MSVYDGAIALPASSPISDLPQPPAGLSPESFAERLYLSLAPLALSDDQNGWSLLILINAIGQMFQELDVYMRDGPDGPGWSALMDVNRCPPEALGWLGQFVGVRLLPDTTTDEQRERIKSTDGFRRGTPEAIRAAAQATLTGTQTVVITERDGDPYVLTVTTLATETPNVAATRTAALSQKPAGLVMNFSGGASTQTYAQLKSRQPTYAAMKAAYKTYNGALLNSNV